MSIYESRKTALLNQMRSENRPLRYAEVRAILGGNAAVKRLENEGVIERLAAGVFAEPGRDTTWDGLAALSCLHPEGIACLETAAIFHGLTDENPSSIHMAFAQTKRVPVHPDFQIEGYRWAKLYLENGVETVDVGSMKVPMTNRARTVVDYIRRMERTGMVEEAMKVLRTYFDTGGNEKDLLKEARAIKVEDRVRPVCQTAMGLRGRF